MLGIYIHLALCNNRCKYCDFNTYALNHLKENYTDALVKSIPVLTHKFDLFGQLADTIYIGGGTPSIFTEQQIEKIVFSIKKNYKFKKNIEFTIETNPESLTNNKLIFYKDIGINRISIGIQSFNDNFLRSLGRAHDSKKALESIEMASSRFNNINIDLIFGLPNQSIKDYEKDLTFFIKQNIPHISCYLLELNKNTYSWRKKILSEKKLVDFFTTTRGILKTKNIYQYEISNYSKKNFECKHNLKYWKSIPYISFGAGAHSFLNHKKKFIRFEHEKNLNKFIKSTDKNIPLFSMFETLKPWERKFDFITTALRMSNGFHLKEYKNTFKTSFEEEFEKSILKNINSGNLETKGERIFLTDRGKIFSNIVFSDFFKSDRS